MYPQARFVGVDFNADHINSANDLAKEAQLNNIEFHQLDFANLESWDIEGFDFAVCFGAFSWINLSLQNNILSFVANKLKTDGCFLIHYAARPGKVQIDPLWHLMRTVTESVPGNSIDRVREGIKIISQLKDKGSVFFKQNPVANKRATALTGQNLNYVAHESLTEWQAFFHSEIAQRARDYGLTFAGPTGQSNVPLEFRIPPSFKSLFNGSMDDAVKETLCDYIHNTGIRTDVFVKDGRKKSSDLDVLDDTAFGIVPLLNETIPPKANTLSGQSISLNDPIPKAILDGTMKQSMTLREIASLPALGKKTKGEVLDMLALLVSIGAIQPLASHYKAAPEGDYASWKLSLPLTGLELASDFPLNQPLRLPSEHTGQCAPLPPLVALILAALHDGVAQNEVANVVADKLLQPGNQIFPNAPNPPKSELIKSLNQQLPLFKQQVLPKLMRMGVCSVTSTAE
jgi:SAM-dependent methyltransferase